MVSSFIQILKLINSKINYLILQSCIISSCILSEKHTIINSFNAISWFHILELETKWVPLLKIQSLTYIYLKEIYFLSELYIFRFLYINIYIYIYISVYSRTLSAFFCHIPISMYTLNICIIYIYLYILHHHPLNKSKILPNI